MPGAALGQIELPINGKTPQTRHASYTGACKAQAALSAKQERYVALLLQAGPITDWEAALRLTWPLSSVNSIRNSTAVRDRVEPRGFEITCWADGRTTKRTKFALRDTNA